MGWLSDYAQTHNEDNSYMKTTKHFYYVETYPDKRGNILTACGIHVSLRETDCVEPSCEVCKKKMEDYELLRIE